jgi:hypothetical protein
LAAVAIALFLASSALAAEQTLSVAVDSLVGQLNSRFSPAVGHVVESRPDGSLVVKFSEGTHPGPDQELLLYRTGEEVVNKLTGERLGGFQQVIGLVRVLEVSQGLGRVQLLQIRSGATARSGDTVKYSSRIDAVVEPPKFFGEATASSEQVADILSLSLERLGRFRPTLLTTKGQAANVWEENRYTFYVQPIVSTDQTGPRIDLKVSSRYTGKPLFVIGKNFSTKPPAGEEPSSKSSLLSSAEKERLLELEKRLQALEAAKKAEKEPTVNPGITEINPIAVSPEEMQRFRASQDLSGSAHLLNIAFGDVDGDGRQELVGIGDRFIKIYRWDGMRFEEFQTIKGSSRSSFIHLDVADINGVGPDEIFVTHLKTSVGVLDLENKLLSFVLEYRGGRFVKIWSDQPYFLRVLKSPQLGRGVLLAQRMGVNEMYRGPVKQFRWSGSEYIQERSTTIPPQFHIYGFMVADLKDSGTPEFFVIQDSGHLASFNQGIEPTWQSNDRVGGFNHVSFKQIPREPTYEKYIRAESTRDEMMVSRRLKGRMEVVQLGGPDNGHYGLLVGSNHEPLLSRALRSTEVLNNGRVVHYAWNGLQYVKEWETKPAERHYLADFAVGDIEGDGTTELVLLLHDTKIIRNPSSRLELFRLGKR